MNILQQLAQYIEDNTSYSRGKTLFIGKQPARDKTINCITIYQTGGFESTGEISDIMDLTVQVIVRNNNYANGAAIAEEIRSLLHGKNKYTLIVNGIFVLYSQAVADFAQHIGEDENGNDEFSINFHLKVR